jgi:hypothetical protein
MVSKMKPRIASLTPTHSQRRDGQHRHLRGDFGLRRGDQGPTE